MGAGVMPAEPQRVSCDAPETGSPLGAGCAVPSAAIHPLSCAVDVSSAEQPIDLWWVRLESLQRKPSVSDELPKIFAVRHSELARLVFRPSVELLVPPSFFFALIFIRLHGMAPVVIFVDF